MAKILIIEDDQSLCELYQHTFVGEGHDVLTAHDGQEGLEKVKIFQPDLILSDYVMPKMTGIDVLDFVKKDPSLAQIKVILVTSLVVDKNEIIAKGAFDVLSKIEVVPSKLIAKVNAALSAS